MSNRGSVKTVKRCSVFTVYQRKQHVISGFSQICIRSQCGSEHSSANVVSAGRMLGSWHHGSDRSFRLPTAEALIGQAEALIGDAVASVVQYAKEVGKPVVIEKLDFRYGVGLNHLPSGRFAAWLTVQVLAHNLARWTARLGLGEQIVTTKTLRRRFCSIAGRLTRSARRPLCIFQSAGPGKPSSVAPSLDCAPCHFRPDGAAGADPPPDYPTASQTRARSLPERLLRHAALTISPSTAIVGRQHPLCVATAPCTQPYLLDQALTVSFPSLSSLV